MRPRLPLLLVVRVSSLCGRQSCPECGGHEGLHCLTARWSFLLNVEVVDLTLEAQLEDVSGRFLRLNLGCVFHLEHLAPLPPAEWET